MRFARLALLAALAACASHEPLGPTEVFGTLGFTYTGGLSGTFVAAGSLMQSDPDDWVAGMRVNHGIDIRAQIPRGGAAIDIVVVVIPRLTAGSSTITATCTSGTCADVIATFGQSTSTAAFLRGCFLESGTITITAISDTRASGAFEGTGTCLDEAGGASSFVVTGGQFDVLFVASQLD